MEKKFKVENLDSIKKKNFLLIGSNFKYSIEQSYLRSFKKLKINNVDFLCENKNFVLKILKKYMNRYIVNIYYILYRKFIINFLKNTKKYDYVIIFKGIEFDLKTLNKIKEYQSIAKWINIYTDNPFNLNSAACSNLNVLNSIRFYDFFCTSFSYKLNKKLQKYKVKKHIFVPFAYDEKIHRFSRKTKKTSNITKINFVGAHDIYREKFLEKLDMEIDIFGPGWKNSNLKNNKIKIFDGFVFGKKLANIFTSYSGSLNILREQDYGSHNMKTFEIPAMGGAMLTPRNMEQKKFFLENKHCLMYSNFSELRKKIKFLITNKNKVRKIKKEAFLISKNYNYGNRLKYLLSKIS